MNKWIFGGVGIVLGAAIGGAVVYFYQERYCVKALEVEQETREDLVDTTRKLKSVMAELETEKFKTEQLLDAIGMFCDENTKGCIADLVNTRMTVRRMRNDGFEEEDITDTMIRGKYDKIISTEKYQKAETVGDEPELNEEDDECIIEEVERGDGIYVISEDEYVRDDLDHQVLFYFALDDTLADEDDDTVDQEIVGAENLEGFSRTDSPAIFVRNERLGMAYEIIWEDGAYLATIGVGKDKIVNAQRIFRPWKDQKEE